VARGYITAPPQPATARDDSFLRKIFQAKRVDRIVDNPPPAPREVAERTPFSSKPISVTFGVDSALLDSAAREAIDRVALVPTAFSGAFIRVEGNTDNIGDVEHNRELSRRRAQAVVNYLVKTYKLPENQFTANGNGPDYPIADNSSPAGRAKNRRTEIKFVKRQQ
jgi:outer membrane protein OmpA-like peptidoglycan-associated protein